MFLFNWSDFFDIYIKTESKMAVDATRFKIFQLGTHTAHTQYVKHEPARLCPMF